MARLSVKLASHEGDAGPECDEALIEPHAVLHCGARFEIIVAMARDHLDKALALLQCVDDRRAAHPERAEIRALLPRLEDEALNEPLALRHLCAGFALLGVVDLVNDDEVDDVPVQERDEFALGVWLLKLFVV